MAAASQTRVEPRLHEHDRYLICPGSEFLHQDPIAVAIYPSSKKKYPTALCDCRTRVWVSPKFDVRDAMSFQDAVDGGFSFAQAADRLVVTPPSDAPGHRYCVCPFSGRRHPGVHAILVKECVSNGYGKRTVWYKAGCHSCACTVFLGSRWGPKTGLTLADVVERKMSVTD